MMEHNISEREKRFIKQIQRLHPKYGYMEIKLLYCQCNSFDKTIEVLEGATLFKITTSEAINLIRETNTLLP